MILFKTQMLFLQFLLKFLFIKGSIKGKLKKKKKKKHLLSILFFSLNHTVICSRKYLT